MATYTGFIVSESLGYFTGVDAIAPGLGTPVPQLWGGIAALAGTLDQATPVPMVQEYDGVMVAGSPLDHIFGHLYVSPLSFDVGNLTGTTQHTLDIWNASLDDVALISAISEGMEGISVELDFDGLVLNGLESLSVSVIFLMDGPPIINGSLVLEFSIGTVTVTFKGRRIVAWVWRPKTPAQEGLEWLSEVLEGRDGSEQRIRLRNAPRQTWELDFDVFDQKAAQMLEVALYGWQGRTWAVPNWMEQTTLQGPITAGETSIVLDTTTSDYRASGMMMLWQSTEVNEIAQILEVYADRVVLLLPTTVNFGAGPILAMPVRTARMVEPVRRVDGVTGAVALQCLFSITDCIALAGDAAPVQYKGMDVLLDRQLVQNATLQNTIERSGNRLDYKTGLWTMDVYGEYSKGTSEMRWELKTRAGIWALREWLHRRAGRVVPFWMPTWRKDLTLVAAVGATSDSLRVVDVAYSRLLLGNAMRKHIMVEMLDGTRYYKEIIGAAAGAPGEEILVLDSTFGAEIQPSLVRRISWLVLRRLDADAVVLRWHASNRVAVSVPIKEIEQ